MILIKKQNVEIFQNVRSDLIQAVIKSKVKTVRLYVLIVLECGQIYDSEFRIQNA